MSGWTLKEIVGLLRLPDPEPLFEEAVRMREAAQGRTVHLRALLETGNECRADCLYCGLRRSNAAAIRYTLDEATIVGIATAAVRGGFRTVVMQSGEDPGTPPEAVHDVVRSIRTRTDAAITLSHGEWPVSVYRMWRSAGADRYLLRFETSNHGLFSWLRPGRTLKARIACLRALGDAGYQVGTGFMVGLPGQTIEDIAGDLLLLHDLDPEMAGIGPYIQHPETPLGKFRLRKYAVPEWDRDPTLSHCGAGEMTLRCLAIARMMNPFLHLPATTALEVRLEEGHFRGLDSGANVLMADVTPLRYRLQYSIYPGRRSFDDTEPAVVFNRYRTMLERAGYAVSAGKGDGRKYEKQCVSCAV